jgi:hypothetical protein
VDTAPSWDLLDNLGRKAVAAIADLGHHRWLSLKSLSGKPANNVTRPLRWLVRVNKRSQRHDKQRLARKASWSIIAAIRLRIFGEANPIK